MIRDFDKDPVSGGVGRERDVAVGLGELECVLEQVGNGRREHVRVRIHPQLRLDGRAGQLDASDLGFQHSRDQNPFNELGNREPGWSASSASCQMALG